ncbi:MAG: glycerophosphodiester phosphodiesterase family protein [Pseudomonadota bacterium]
MDVEEPQATYNWSTLNGAAPLVIAHRGASGYRPEHTLAAYELAIDQGADIIEPDLMMTKDGVLIARHDRFLSKTTNVASLPEFAERKRTDTAAEGTDPTAPGEDWWIEDFTVEELKTLKARQSKETRSKDFDDQFDIPTFGEILVLASVKAQETGRAIGIYPEIKYPSYFKSIGLEFEGSLALALSGYTDGPLAVQSFEKEALQSLSTQTDVPLIYLLTGEPDDIAASLGDVPNFASAIGLHKSKLVTETGDETAIIDQAHGLGLSVFPWGFRDDVPYLGTPQQEIQTFMKLGVDGLFTDYPDTAIAARLSLLNGS